MNAPRRLSARRTPARARMPALLAALALGLLPGAAGACDDQDADGMDVALVLSGGGAFAATHVGVLELVEAMDIPVHCVVGTSMGAVVGGLYAAGYEADDLKEIFRSSDWSDIFSGAIERSNKPYLEKELEGQYFSGPVASITRDGLEFPGGWREMRGLKSHFRRLTAHIDVNADFDALRVPYRAVATDLSTGEARALSEGDITEAMLASMAVPGIFAPREIGGRVYVDGGLSAQLPVGVARAMGADLIIAVDTTVEPPAIDSAPSLGETTGQLVRLIVWRNWKDDVARLGEADTLIRPSLEDLTVSSFERAETAFEAGRAAARLARDKLAAIKARAAPPRTRDVDPERLPSSVEDVLIANETIVSDDVILRRFDFDPDAIDEPEEIERRLKDIAAFGGFGEVSVGLSGDNALLDVRRRSLTGVLVQAGLRASTTFDGDSAYGLLGRLSLRPVSARGGEASLAFEVGSNFGVAAELFQPFGREGRVFVIPAGRYRSEELIFDVGDLRLGEFVQEQATAELRLGRELGQWGIIALEGVVGAGELTPQVVLLPSDLEPFSYSLGGVGVMAGVDTLDKLDWPTRGLQFRAANETLFDLGDGQRTDIYRIFAMKPFSFGDTGVILRARMETVENDDNDPIEVLSLGGFRQLTAFSENSLPNNEYVFASVEAFRRLTAADAVVSFPIYVGVTVEYANAAFDLFEEGERANFASGGVYIGAQTLLGPAFFGAGFAEEGQYSLFLHLGRSF